MPIVHTTMQPDIALDVSDAEARNLLGQGILAAPDAAAVQAVIDAAVKAQEAAQAAAAAPFSSAAAQAEQAPAQPSTKATKAADASKEV